MDTTIFVGRGAPTVIDGNELRRLRAARHWSQPQLAEKSGVSQSQISELERGKIDAPKPGTLQALAGALGVSVEALLRAVSGGAASVGANSGQGVTLGEWSVVTGTVPVPVWGEVPAILSEFYRRLGVDVSVPAVALRGASRPIALRAVEDQVFRVGTRVVFRVRRDEYVTINLDETEAAVGRIYLVEQDGRLAMLLWSRDQEEDCVIIGRVLSSGEWREAP